ncbi:MAG: ATP-dependent protease, partial [Synergistaceae bacterium]|nr:ATP-dependent protease [Synergistaceae bacterium]
MSGVLGVTLRGMEALPVEVEVEITGGIFSISIVGMPDVAIKESRERVRAALRS